MQSNIMQIEAIQPFVKLAQSNMELLTKFSQSPEVMAEATRTVKTFMEQAQTSTASLAGSSAFAGLMQGMVKNYTDFISELTQSAYAMVSQSQAAFLQQTQEAASNVIDADNATSIGLLSAGAGFTTFPGACGPGQFTFRGEFKISCTPASTVPLTDSVPEYLIAPVP